MATLLAFVASAAAATTTTRPAPPSGLRLVAAGADSLAVAWDPAGGTVVVYGYRIFRNGTKIADIPASPTSYTLTGLHCARSYTIGVAARGAGTILSGQTKIKAATAACTRPPPDTTPPSVPSALQLSAHSSSSLSLSWAASSDNVGVAAYDVYLDGAKLASTTGLGYTFSALAPQTSYTLAVSARDAAGNVSARATLSAETDSDAGSGAGAACGFGQAPPATYDHVIWIVMENRSLPAVIGNAAAPYLSSLAGRCGYSTQWLDNVINADSEPEYEALVSGSNCDTGIGTTGTNCNVGSDADPTVAPVLDTQTIFNQVADAGGSWKAYAESMSSNCQFTSGGFYAAKHNPPVFFNALTEGGHVAAAPGSPCDQRDVGFPAITCPATVASPCQGSPAGDLYDDLENDTLPTFSFVTPNVCNDDHSHAGCAGTNATMMTTVSDNWMATWMPLILASRAYRAGRTAVFVLYDEGSYGQPQPNIIISPYTDGVVSSATLDNIAALRTTEDTLGLPDALGCASGTPPGGVGSCPAGSSSDFRSLFGL